MPQPRKIFRQIALHAKVGARTKSPAMDQYILTARNRLDDFIFRDRLDTSLQARILYTVVLMDVCS
jgi:hypothetical protein